MQRIALVTGGNRGIGFEICRQLAALGLHVLLGARDPEAGREAAGRIRGDVEPIGLDLDDPEAPARALDEVRSRGLPVDVLINNAAVYLERGASVLDVDVDVVRRTLAVNVLAPFTLAQAVVPGMVSRGWGRLVNVSSGAGQSTASGDWAPGYSASKAALNLLTRQLATATAGTGVLVNAVCPGWVRTDMGGPKANRSVEEGADTPVWLATLPDDGPTGGLFRDREPIPW